MKVLFVTATYPPSANGVAISTQRMAEALRSLGHQVAVIGPATGQSGETDYIAMPTIRMRGGRLSDYPVPIPWISPARIEMLRSGAWDIIHVQHPFAYGETALRMGRILAAPVVFSYHTRYDRYLETMRWLPRPIRSEIYDRGVLRMLPRFDAVVAVTKWMQVHLLGLLKRGSHVHYVSSAGLPNPFQSNDMQSTTALKTELALQAPVFLSVTRLSPEKNTERLVQAFLYWAERHETGAYVLIGDGPERTQLERVAQGHPQGSRVVFRGQVPNRDLPVWYTLATVFLYSSHSDVSALNIIEAMSAGLPVVSPRNPTADELIQGNYNGILTEPSAAAISEGMQQAVERLPVLSAGARRTSQAYDCRSLAEKLLDVYAGVIREFKGRQAALAQ